jgi:hypothetical protein
MALPPPTAASSSSVNSRSGLISVARSMASSQEMLRTIGKRIATFLC